MESQKQNELSDEDIPSDFFDDFSKDEFIEGLSVIDSWDVEEGVQKRSSRSRIDAVALDGVRDLRELIRDGRNETESRRQEKYEDRYKRRRYERDSSFKRHSSGKRRESNSSQLDNYIKPGSRRDLRKTNEAIRKDKQVKVKEYLSKHLDSIDDLKPPGTELDDFLNEPTITTKKRNISSSPVAHYSKQPSIEIKYRESPRRPYQHKERRSIYRSPRRINYINHHHSRYSPHHKPRHFSPSWRPRRHYSPGFSARRSSRPRYSPVQRSPSRHSPLEHRRDERFHSPSPMAYSYTERDSPSVQQKDTFLYPNEHHSSNQALPISNQYQTGQAEFYSNPGLNAYPGAPQYSYSQCEPYVGYNASYEYGAPPNIGLVQAVSAPVVNSAPSMVPPPLQSTPANPAVIAAVLDPPTPQEKPFDALAKLVVEGKISKEDYLKLAPNKGTIIDNAADTHVRVKVLNRCHEALNKLSKLELPNRLLINNALIGPETKSIAPKYCSPLKRQAAVDFYFTKASGKVETVHQNQQLIDSIISTLGLNDIVSRSSKKNRKGMKDAAVQTMKPFCEVCQIRESTQSYEIGTCIDRQDFTTTVHTQVLEQDLISSKAIFNPSGSVSDSAPISIAHLTPAQLVSQLAARAKTLKQSEVTHHSQFYRNPGNSYDYDGRGNGNQYNYSYRY
ncbi:unnamed protein product [Parnassius apollo]|uniref:(apollo) hypothetical protein n=1 Tax=Parnassius apollo TaxID=110799 RepID=A0A8S3XUW1_PARAO|nr:unnamed protein product [Parnassius apollo]